MQSRPRLANVSGVVVGPVPAAVLPLHGTGNDSELGLPTTPAARAGRLERSSTEGRSLFMDSDEAVAATPVENGLEDIDWTDVAVAVVMVI